MQCSLFGWLKGKQQQAGVAVETHDTVTEDKLPFPLSILNNTHLQGKRHAAVIPVQHTQRSQALHCCMLPLLQVSHSVFGLESSIGTLLVVRQSRLCCTSMTLHLALLGPHLQGQTRNVCSAGRQLACAYRATAHGWGALQFHKHSDMKGPCVIYCETEHGARFGGFNSEGFKSSDDYTSSSKAFLFCWTASDGALVILHKVCSC